jgi:hypothetical protein
VVAKTVRSEIAPFSCSREVVSGGVKQRVDRVGGNRIPPSRQTNGGRFLFASKNRNDDEGTFFAAVVFYL